MKELSLAFCRPEPRVPKGPEPREESLDFRTIFGSTEYEGTEHFRGSTIFEGSMVFLEISSDFILPVPLNYRHRTWVLSLALKGAISPKPHPAAALLRIPKPADFHPGYTRLPPTGGFTRILLPDQHEQGVSHCSRDPLMSLEDTR